LIEQRFEVLRCADLLLSPRRKSASKNAAMPMQMSSKSQRLPELLRSCRPEWFAGGVLAVALLFVYLPELTVLAQRWAHDSRYSHGFLVPLFALYLLYARRGRLANTWRPSWWGAPILVAGLAVHAAGIGLYLDWLNAISLLPCLAGVAVLLGGWPCLRWAWPGVAFLIFMVPLPFQLEVGLAQPLQRLGTVVSTYALQTLGFPAFAEGNVIRMGEVRLGVVEACSGLSMLVIFFALATAVGVLVRRPLWERLLLVASAIPIALLANIIRIVVTGVLHKVAGRALADLVFHDLAGWLMMPLALGFLWLELRLLAWVIRTREVQENTSSVRNSFHGGSSPWTRTSRPAPRRRV
jgi:exosortase